MAYLNINDAALARHIKQFYHKNNDASQIITCKLDDQQDFLATGYIAVKVLLGLLPKTRAALAECNISATDKTQINGFINGIKPRPENKPVAVTPTGVQVLSEPRHPTTLRVYHSSYDSPKLWFFNTRLLDIFGDTVLYNFEKSSSCCYIRDETEIKAVIVAWRPDKPMEIIRTALTGVKL